MYVTFLFQYSFGEKADKIFAVLIFLRYKMKDSIYKWLDGT
jgi:hypothetical protein